MWTILLHIITHIAIQSVNIGMPSTQESIIITLSVGASIGIFYSRYAVVHCQLIKLTLISDSLLKLHNKPYFYYTQ